MQSKFFVLPRIKRAQIWYIFDRTSNFFKIIQIRDRFPFRFAEDF